MKIFGRPAEQLPREEGGDGPARVFLRMAFSELQDTQQRDHSTQEGLVIRIIDRI